MQSHNFFFPAILESWFKYVKTLFYRDISTRGKEIPRERRKAMRRLF